ncbi:MAG: HD domain-containing phosphohydrolase, partial [Planctomycetota bacterium]
SEGDREDRDVVVVAQEGGIGNTTLELLVPGRSEDFLEEQMAAAQSPERLLRDLSVLYRISNSINGVRDPDALLETVLESAFETVEATHGFLVIVEESGGLAVKARRFSSGYDRTLSISQAVADAVVEKGRAVLINDALHDERFSPSDSIIAHHLRSVLCVPLACKEKVLGFIYLDNPIVTGAFTSDDLRLVSAIAIQAAVAIENSRLFGALEELMFGAIGALVAAVEAKDRYIRGHSERVARISRAVGEEMGLRHDDLKVVHLAALLHDIGKIGISEAILHKEGPLTDEERRAIREHAARGASILENISDMAEVADAVRHHHEFWDGRGYPDGISDEQVPLASRIITAADAYDAMTSDRPYRSRLEADVCLSEIVGSSGSQFDPSVVEALLKVARKRRLSLFGQTS